MKATLVTIGAIMAFLAAPAHAAEETGLNAGLIGHYTFDKAAEGNVTADSSGKARNGAVHGATWKDTGGFDGKGYYEFDGADDYIDLGKMKKTASYAISVYVKFGSHEQTKWAGIVFGGNGYTGWGLAANYGANGKVACRTSDGKNMDGWHIEPLNEKNYPPGWHHLVLMADGETMFFYKDGVMVGSKDQTVGNSGADKLSIGRWGTYHGVDAYFKGAVDELRLYDRALTVEEINTLCKIKKAE